MKVRKREWQVTRTASFFLLYLIVFCGYALAADPPDDNDDGTLKLICVPADSKKAALSSYNEVKAVNLAGPRVGLTVIFGELANELVTESKCTLKEDGKEDGKESCEVVTRDFFPVISQFGWQLEKRFATSPDGSTGVAEAVLLIGGAEQNVFLPSASFLIGFRTPKGIEI